ncbi:hypothetical protein M1E21_003559 [Acinetobacter baumannii]|uniref:hypothetical protein n=1 Tax=Acinetobacter baumannii TaxID=470 RepID=UPI0004F525B4|nr:hypothetical protein [Acinetobacter baumannii]HEM7379606.1 hypothetical protein [Acinetobacter nosocomialis]EKT7999245.1 hypothetical protein [Acinetobacter baumannii]EKT8313491.1 hypothetical protein [Acinetobacter baumannii]EKT9116239.1 hypothetical protein [Acinetobacter baumannii]EKT9782766.1 hypothetical protein [Acinetobacter baumannii]
MDASAKPMSCRPYGVRTLSGQAPGMALYKFTNLNIGGIPPMKYKVNAMFSLTLRTKDGFELELKVNLYWIIIAITNFIYWIA